MSFVMQSADDEQGQAWEHFYKSVCNVLRRSGAEDHFGKADYWVVDDNYGWRETHVEVHNLKMLAPAVIAHLRSLLAKDSAWQISVAVHVPGTKPGWPVMGLTIRAHEIIDGLQRQYFPEPYRSFQYEGARPGSEYD